MIMHKFKKRHLKMYWNIDWLGFMTYEPLSVS